eukprot:scaffold569_cov408-Prasinococcus_capsulatus_cf.AAC.58
MDTPSAAMSVSYTMHTACTVEVLAYLRDAVRVGLGVVYKLVYCSSVWAIPNRDGHASRYHSPVAPPWKDCSTGRSVRVERAQSGATVGGGRAQANAYLMQFDRRCTPTGRTRAGTFHPWRLPLPDGDSARASSRCDSTSPEDQRLGAAASAAATHAGTLAPSSATRPPHVAPQPPPGAYKTRTADRPPTFHAAPHARLLLRHPVQAPAGHVLSSSGGR